VANDLLRTILGCAVPVKPKDHWLGVKIKKNFRPSPSPKIHKMISYSVTAAALSTLWS